MIMYLRVMRKILKNGGLKKKIRKMQKTWKVKRKNLRNLKKANKA